MREQRKVVTVLFCDLVGSTALGESTDPEALRARMRRYFEDLRAIVERHGGTVEKFVGDAVMAVFGIPTAHEDDAFRAVRAASEMREAIAARGLEARIGINTGEVMVGGDSETLVTGDAVNVAARLEQAAAAGETLIGDRTRMLVRDAARTEPVAPLRLKGKAEPVEAHRLLEVVGDDPIARRPETPLVGRERERRRLWRDYEDCVADRACRLFTLLGPAGIGKSRLVADFLDRVGSSADVLRGRCLHYGDGITYWPLVEMLAPLGIAAEDVVASTPEETRVTFRRLLEDRAAERPQVVVVDDLQWAEPVFVDLVEHVADLSRGVPIFLLCIARTELLESRPDWGGGKLNATSLLLEPLDAAACDRLIELLAQDTVDAELRQRIASVSAGFPLYVEEMLAMLRERGGDDAVSVPPTIQALLQARIDSLDGDVRVVLERGAIEGEVFHRGAVATLVPASVHGDVDKHLSSLVRKELIWPERSLAPGEEAYRFRHILIRDVAYGSMPKALRAELHEGFAGWLSERDADSTFERDEILGYHLEQAYHFQLELGPVDDETLAARAAERLLQAGRRAFARIDLPAAVSLLERGAALLRPGDPVRLDALIDLSQALARRGELERTDELLRATIAEARAAGDAAAEARGRLAHNRLRGRMDPEADVGWQLAEAIEIAASLEGTGKDAHLARALIVVGSSRFMLGHAAEGDEDLRRASRLAREVGVDVVEREALSARLRPVAWGPMPASEGIGFCESLLRNQHASVADRAHALQVMGLLSAMTGDFEASRVSASRASALIEEYGLMGQRGICAIDIGWSLLVAGELDEAERELRRGHEILVAVGDTGARCTLDAILAETLYRLDRYDDAAGFTAESRAVASVDDLDAQPRWRAAQALVESARGHHTRAEQLAREAVTLIDETDFLPLKGTVYGSAGVVLAAAGKSEEGVALVERAIACQEQKGDVASAARSRATLAELSARPS